MFHSHFVCCAKRSDDLVVKRTVFLIFLCATRKPIKYSYVYYMYILFTFSGAQAFYASAPERMAGQIGRHHLLLLYHVAWHDVHFIFYEYFVLGYLRYVQLCCGLYTSSVDAFAKMVFEKCVIKLRAKEQRALEKRKSMTELMLEEKDMYIYEIYKKC